MASIYALRAGIGGARGLEVCVDPSEVSEPSERMRVMDGRKETMDRPPNDSRDRRRGSLGSETTEGGDTGEVGRSLSSTARLSGESGSLLQQELTFLGILGEPKVRNQPGRVKICLSNGTYLFMEI